MYGLNMVLFGLMFGLVMLPEVLKKQQRLTAKGKHEYMCYSESPRCHYSSSLDSHGSSLRLHPQENCSSGRAAHSHGLFCAL